jgi:hypothetical protein
VRMMFCNVHNVRNYQGALYLSKPQIPTSR